MMTIFIYVSCTGYDLSLWKDTLIKLGQTRVYFSTTAEPPYRSKSMTLIFEYYSSEPVSSSLCLLLTEAVYRVEMATWTQYLRWGVVILRLHNGMNVTEARIDK